MKLVLKDSQIDAYLYMNVFGQCFVYVFVNASCLFQTHIIATLKQTVGLTSYSTFSIIANATTRYSPVAVDLGF